ncbi:cell shape determination protein CcmA [Brevibacillus brevis]|uniref:cell shape determination protein CcmA n=1 Tax=Brevibacillus brevis TaxID=1393 RepID=UPI000B3AA3FA|nr:cell shape determination protein CcmA [Brevibacillus brevis]MBH0330675.1 cell shape determination protein CcmA [Brevibacillus brevis]OUQ90373.1 cell shape determination protein CcmA [Brevibacillus brevis]
MQNENKNKLDLIFHGAVNATGGVYNKVDVQGYGKINGDVECESLHCAGHVSITGDLIGSSARVEGNASIKGKVKMDTLSVYGQLDVADDLNFTSLKVGGNVKVQGNMAGEDVKVHGSLKTAGDCEAEVFRANGAFSIGGLLNAGRIEVILHGSCEAKEIGGEYIEVRRTGSSTLGKLLKHFLNNTLSVETIEGDEIYLENTKAKVVRGNKIEIGPDCEIDLVEYSTECKQDQSSQIKTLTQR